MGTSFTLDLQDRRFQEVKRRFLDRLGAELQSGKRVVVINEPTRSNEQSALMWALLHDLEDQVGFRPARWRGDRCVEDGGYVLLIDEPKARHITAEQFKDLTTALWKRPRMFAGLEGGIVAVGVSTSRMSIRQLSQLIDVILAFGSQLGVVFSDPPPATAPSYHPEAQEA